jgi:SAM-dependent methyltransferase
MACAKSFRDPAGFVFRLGDRILRAVHPGFIQMLREFLALPLAQEFVRQGRVIGASFPVEPEEPGYEIVEHERVWFPSFPSEWSAEMLESAANLTLDLVEQLLSKGWGLKDASPHNILFQGPRPVFVDLLSFERRDPRDALWPAYAQFVRTFLLPLMAHRYSLARLDQIWLAGREGLEPESVYRALSWRRRMTPPALDLVTIPVWFSRRAERNLNLYRKNPVAPERASYTLAAIYKGLRRKLRSLETRSLEKCSNWLHYLECQTHYSPQQFAAKEAFVSEVLREFSPRAVLDAGANVGHFSEMAARAGASVIAIDSDPALTGELWRRASRKCLDILPLVVDLCRPTPPLGWRNRESPSFLDRATGAFDLVMMLALVHHMLVTERIPLPEIVDLAADLTSSLLVIEFVDPTDPMFRRLARGRDALYAHLTQTHFEAACASRFQIVRRLAIAGSSRTLYLLRRKS